MEERELFRGLKRWIRFRGAVAGAAVGVGVLLLAGMGLSWAGQSLPALGWLLPFLLSLVGWWWPRDWTWALWWAGRRLGVGGRLAAAQALSSEGERDLLALVLSEINGRRWGGRLLWGRQEGLVALLLVALTLLYLFPPPLPGRWGYLVSRPEAPTPAEQPLEPAELPAPTAASQPVPQYPQGEELPGHQELLARLYGLEPQPGLPPEELAREISSQQALLSELARQLSQSLPHGPSPQEQERLVALARQVAREDLRRELTRLLEGGGPQAAEEAREAVQAVLQSGEELAAGGSGAPQPGEGAGEAALSPAGPGEGTATVSGPEVGTVGGPPGGAPAGLQPEAPPQPGEEAFTGTAEPQTTLSPELEAQPGPSRAYLAPGVPGEPPGSPPAGLSIPTPSQVDLSLRAQGVPPELRDLVRRYFQLIRELSGGSP